MAFSKGQSGNPAGRKPSAREIAQKHLRNAVSALVSIVDDANAEPAVRTRAACALLEFGAKPATKKQTKTDARFDAAMDKLNEQIISTFEEIVA